MHQSDTMLCIVAALYNVYHLNYPKQGKFTGVFFKKTKFEVTGKNVSITIGRKTRIENCLFHIHGNNTSIEIGEKCILQNLEIWIEDDYGSISIGQHTTIEGGHIAATEGCIIEVGNDCMFSSMIEIRNGDSHPIFNRLLNTRINNALPVKIGDHVWLGKGVSVLKGSKIGNNSIVGTCSLVSGDCSTMNALYVGTPARIRKEDIMWERER
jgi:acetyltransferase-like isoleucine patch superfamily enzyme